jgi:hypothetical protein
MPNIATIAAKLEMRDDGFSRTTLGAAKSLDRLATQAEGAGKRFRDAMNDQGAGRSFKGIAAAGLERSMQAAEGFHRALGKIEDGPLKAIGGLFGMLPGAIGASASALAALTIADMRQDAATSKLAQALDVSLPRFQALELAGKRAGLSQEDVYASLQRVERAIGEGLNAASPAAEAFDRLGLSARQLAGVPTDQALLQIADALERIPNRAVRAAAAHELLGKSAANMSRFLRSGSRGVERAAEDLRRNGLLLTDEQGEAAQRAAVRVSQLSLAWDGLKKSLANAFAPLLERVVEGLGHVAGATNAVVQTVANAGEPRQPERRGSYIVSPAPMLSFEMQNLQLIQRQEAAQARANEQLERRAALGEKITAGERRRILIEAMEHPERFGPLRADVEQKANEDAEKGLNRLMLAWDRLGESIGKTAEEMAAADALRGFTNWENLAPAIERVRDNMDRIDARRLAGDIRTAGESLTNEIANVGLSPWQARIRELETRLSRLQGLTDEKAIEARRRAEADLERMRAQAELVTHRDQMREFGDPFREARESMERLLAAFERAPGQIDLAARRAEILQRALGFDPRGPLEKFQAEMQRLEVAGRELGLTEDVRALAMARAVDELERASGAVEHRAPEALLAGTREAMSAIAAHQRSGAHETEDQRVRRLLERAEQQRQDQLQAARDTARAVERQQRPRVARF